MLGLGRGAAQEEVKAAYRRLALEIHPDRRGADDGGEKFSRVNEAYRVLKGAGREEAAPRPRPPPPPPERGARRPPGGGGGGSPPEQDWSRHTREFEEGNPGFWKEYERNFWKEYEKTVNADGRNGEYEKAKERGPRPDLFVDVDPSLCIACQSCETIAPGVFSIDKNSNLNPKSRVINMRGEGRNKIMNAAETCPTKAIIVEDRGEGRRLYPL